MRTDSGGKENKEENVINRKTHGTAAEIKVMKTENKRFNEITSLCRMMSVTQDVCFHIHC